MIRLANTSLRRPKLTLIVWLVVVAGLGFVGSRIGDRFSPSVLVVKGTQSARAQDIARSRFGNSVLVPIMLTGPASQLDAQGPRLVAALRARADTRVLSPWDKSPGSAALRPRPGTATIVTAVERSEKTVANTIQPQIDRTVHRYVVAPVTAHVTGQPSIDRAMRHEAISTTRTAILIALPTLFLLCAVLFGTPVVAALVVTLAGTVLAVGYGFTALTARIMEVDPVAVAGAAILGLVLSSSFALIMESRYREERRTGDSATAAATRAVASTGRTVLLAGTAVVAMLIIATLLATTQILNSVGAGALVTSAVATTATVAVLPAILVLFDSHLDAFSFRGLGDRLTAHLPSRVPAGLIRHPAVIGGVTFLLLAALSIPVFKLGSGPPDPRYLPSDNGARQAYEAVSREMGPGWVTPFELVVTKQQGTITTRQFLAVLNRYQQALAKDSAVVSVVGPGTIASNANQLQGVPQGLNTAARTAKKSKKDLKTLIAGLGQAGSGVQQVRAGLSAAASGAAQLSSGSGQAASGSAQLSSGIQQASAGAQQLSTGLDQASSGANQLASGSATASSGAKELAKQLGVASSGVTAGLPTLKNLAADVSKNASAASQLGAMAQSANADVNAALQAMSSMTTGKSDPQYPTAVGALQRAAGSTGGLESSAGSLKSSLSGDSAIMNAALGQITALQAGLVKLKAGADQLSTGITKISVGNAGLAAGLHKLSGGGHALSSGLSQLSTGAQQLQAGIGAIHGGAGQLASGLSGGVSQSAPLQSGMSQITAAVIHSRKSIPSTAAVQTLHQQSPHLFDSGYFVLAALQGAPTASRQAAGFTVNVEQGGAAGRITVVPKWGANDPRTRALADRLTASSAAFAKRTGTEAALGGNAASLIQYRDVAASKLPAVIAGLLLCTYLLLLVVTRSLLLPLVAVVFNAATAGATFGLLTLLFGSHSPLLGGPGFMDPVTIISIATVVLALSAVYEVFVLSLSRERYDAGATDEAAYYGINHTWSVVTLATVPMLVATLLFTPALLTIVRELAIGTLIAIAINATVVRLVLLPAAMSMLGRFNWWMPGWLSRTVPRVHFGGMRTKVGR
jgi:putative drug exporter of the RND superfamily